MKHAREALEKYGTVIITGGSSGIGKALLEAALQLEVNLNIANLSRSEPRLRRVTENYKHFPCDLTDSAAIRESFGELEAWLDGNNDPRPVLLINNSGFGCYGPFPEPSLEENLKMLDLNIRAVVELTGLLLPRILSSGGGVVHVASTASFQPLSYMSAYAATKAFVLHWGLALHQELKRGGSFCLTVCPGPTATDFFRRAGFSKEPTRGMGQTAEQVAITAFRGIARRKSLMTSGFMNWIGSGLGGMSPKRWVAPVTARLIRSLRLEKYRKRD